jgi:integrase/recombinase XerD
MKRGERRPPPPIGDPNDPHGLWVWTQRYLEWLAVRHFSERTVRQRRVYLGYFLGWCEARSLRRPVEVTRPILERYQRQLYHARKADGHPLSFTSQTGRVVVVRGFFRWLVRENALLANPAADLVMPRAEKRLPRAVLSPLEADTVMNQPNVADPIGLRDRAMLEQGPQGSAHSDRRAGGGVDRQVPARSAREVGDRQGRGHLVSDRARRIDDPLLTGALVDRSGARFAQTR